MNESVLLTRDGSVATLTLNRPQDLNVLDGAMIDVHMPIMNGIDPLGTPAVPMPPKIAR